MILVTGGCGFIGSHVVEACRRCKQPVRVLDDLSTGSRDHLDGLEVEIVEGDICDADTLQAALQGVGRVIHLAAFVSVSESFRQPGRNDRVNIHGTRQVLQAAERAGVQRVVLASSAAIYADQGDPLKHESMLPLPSSPYGISKRVNEFQAHASARGGDLDTVSFRFFNVYGPRQDPRSPYSGVISRFMDWLAADQPLTVFGDGSQTRDYIYVQDIARTVVAAALQTAPLNGAVLNLGTGSEISVLNLARVCMKVADREVEIEFVTPRAGDVLQSCADITLARHLLQFEPSTVLEAGLEQTWNFLQSSS